MEKNIKNRLLVHDYVVTERCKRNKVCNAMYYLNGKRNRGGKQGNSPEGNFFSLYEILLFFFLLVPDVYTFSTDLLLLLFVSAGLFHQSLKKPVLKLKEMGEHIQASTSQFFHSFYTEKREQGERNRFMTYFCLISEDTNPHRSCRIFRANCLSRGHHHLMWTSKYNNKENL